jgi:hypothetical protein
MKLCPSLDSFLEPIAERFKKSRVLLDTDSFVGEGFTRGEEGALPREFNSLTFFCNSGGYLPYIFL